MLWSYVKVDIGCHDVHTAEEFIRGGDLHLLVHRGIEVNETTLNMQVMRDVCIGGPGHYLGHDQTISLMQTEYIYPEIGDRSSPKEWEELNKPNLVETAIKRKQEILDNFHPTHLSAELDADLRGKFRILLDA